nr:immunoglobulin light chain junction region [Macaca mulatta]MOV61211.1 immunoglobulin light chain junction region [Macaca mulatta]MOV61368.1 immunoglobulin light chain junction region [Macaca mulatta]MOV61461.1 immunoglobulin light chain junction region [Macaca mulatta]MOV62212.1 immunoglobulin light chain junction region [Macaca mulatta]
CQQHNRYPYTF